MAATQIHIRKAEPFSIHNAPLLLLLAAAALVPQVAFLTTALLVFGSN